METIASKVAYISGKITGLEIWDYQLNFTLVELILIDQGYEIIINPIRLKPLFGVKKWWAYMAVCLWKLLFCDVIYMQNNWKDSRGAMVEHRFAKLLRLEIIYEKEI